MGCWTVIYRYPHPYGMLKNPSEMRALNEGLSQAVSMGDKEYNTALIYASTRNHLALAQLLLEIGSDVDSTHIHGENVFFSSVERGFWEMVKFLLESGVKINQKTFWMKPPSLFRLGKGI